MAMARVLIGSCHLAAEHKDVTVREVEQRIDEEDETAERHRSSEPWRYGAGLVHGRYYSDAMQSNGLPRVVISGHRRRVAVRRGARLLLANTSAAASAARARSRSSTRRRYPCRVAAWVPPVSVDDARARSRATTTRTAARIRSATRGRRCSASSRRAKRGATPAFARASPDAGVLIGSGGGGIDVGEKQYEDFFTVRRPARDAVRDCRRHLRHGLERDLDFARPARHQPRAVVRLHELDRRASATRRR